MATQDIIKSNLIALGFDNPSAKAIYNQFAEAAGLVVDNTISEITNSENIITSIISNQRYGKNAYYTGKALAFQYGDDLIVDPLTLDYIYAEIDNSKLIINQAAFEEIKSGNSSQLFIKIATIDSITGDLIPLNTPQLNAFQSYFGVFEIPGLPVSIINSNGNIINFTSTASYYATYDLSTLMNNLSIALRTFKNTFTFDGEFFDGDLEAFIKSNVPGIRDFYIFNTTIDSTPFGGSQKLPSGYFNYNSGILSNINYASI